MRSHSPCDSRTEFMEVRDDFPRAETGRIHKHILRREGAWNSWGRNMASTRGATHG